jgi:hypothetical protein
MDDLEYGESWTITKEYFPEVKIHILMQHDDEELGGDPYELQFLFSGNRVSWISGEDLCHLCEILLNYAVSKITEQLPQNIYKGEPSPLLSKAMRERTIKWQDIPMDKELHSHFTFTPFPGLEIDYDIASTPTNFIIETKKMNEFWIYDVDRLIIMGLNQILRLVKIRLDKLGIAAPSICNMMFSGYYKKMHSDKFQ